MMKQFTVAVSVKGGKAIEAWNGWSYRKFDPKKVTQYKSMGYGRADAMTRAERIHNVDTPTAKNQRKTLKVTAPAVGAKKGAAEAKVPAKTKKPEPKQTKPPIVDGVCISPEHFIGYRVGCFSDCIISPIVQKEETAVDFMNTLINQLRHTTGECEYWAEAIFHNNRGWMISVSGDYDPKTKKLSFDVTNYDRMMAIGAVVPINGELKDVTGYDTAPTVKGAKVTAREKKRNQKRKDESAKKIADFAKKHSSKSGKK